MDTASETRWVDELVREVPGVAAGLGPGVDLRRHSAFGVGGRASCLFVPPGATIEAQAEATARLIGWCRRQGVPYFPLGNASNTILGDVAGVVAARPGPGAQIVFEGRHVTAEAGVMLPHLAEVCRRHDLSGLEFGLGVPGTLGGAVVTNAYSDMVDVEATREAGNAVPNRLVILDGLYPKAATRQNMARCVVSVTVVDASGEIRVLSKADLDYLEPHWSAFLAGQFPGAVIMGATLQLTTKPASEIARIVETFAGRRRLEQQPTGLAVGPVFAPNGYTRPDGAAVFTDHEAWFTDADSLIGRAFHDEAMRREPIREGGLMCRLSCPCFFANDGGGTLDDFLRLFERVHARVEKVTGIRLVSGVRFLPASLAPSAGHVSPTEYRQWRYRLYQRMATDFLREDPMLAVQYAEKALQFRPGAPVAVFNKALGFACMKHWPQALETLAEMKPADAALEAGRELLAAEACHSLGRYAEAVQHYGRFGESEFFGGDSADPQLLAAIRKMQDAASARQPLLLDLAHPFHPSKIDLSD